MRFSHGDIVRLDLDPSRGHEQTKRRYAVVVSNDWYNAHCNLTMICPITSTDNGYPLHVDLGEQRVYAQDSDADAVHGFVQVEQLKALDLNARRALYVGRLDTATAKHVTELTLACRMGVQTTLVGVLSFRGAARGGGLGRFRAKKRPNGPPSGKFGWWGEMVYIYPVILSVNMCK